MKRLPLPVIVEDKANHFIYGATIYSLSCILFTLLHIEPVLYSLIVVAVIAALKELHDKYTPGSTPDFMDWVWTMLGCVPTLLVQFIK